MTPDYGRGYKRLFLRPLRKQNTASILISCAPRRLLPPSRDHPKEPLNNSRAMARASEMGREAQTLQKLVLWRGFATLRPPIRGCATREGVVQRFPNIEKLG